MHAWPAPDVPALETAGPPVQLHDTSRGEVVPTEPGPDGARLYVCGITPYDATHMGHAATYVAFDLLNRAWRNAGHRVTFVENVTDVDDPLLERATKVGTGWEELALRETQLFREDMVALNVLPPAHFVGAVESIPWVLELIAELDSAGATYVLDGDVYYAVGSDTAFGQVSGWSRETMLEIFPERGGDPDREGKRDPLDPLLWRAERPGEPSWPSSYGPGRPGWHVECSAIAQRTLGGGFDVQAGGSDLVFPHHEMSAGHAQVATDSRPFARIYAHAGMVGYDGEKMSKSRGNLVFVSALRRSDVDPMAIRLVLLEHHYRSDWEWRDALVFDAVETLATWREVLHADRAGDPEPLIRDVLDALADDLDAPRAVLAVEEWMQAARQAPADPVAAKKVRDLLDAALGLAL